jgi:hypothetical protein
MIPRDRPTLGVNRLHNPETEMETCKEIAITDEMVRRACIAVHGMGGIPFNPHLGPETNSATVREILEVALGLREADP